MFKVELTAIHDVDLKKVLIKLGLYDKVVNGEVKCFVCGRPINWNNIGGVFKSKDDSLHLICNNMKCLLIASQLSAEITKHYSKLSTAT